MDYMGKKSAEILLETKYTPPRETWGEYKQPGKDAAHRISINPLANLKAAASKNIFKILQASQKRGTLTRTDALSIVGIL